MSENYDICMDSSRKKESDSVLLNSNTNKIRKNRLSRRDTLINKKKKLLYVHERDISTVSFENIIHQALLSKDNDLLASIIKIDDPLVIRSSLSKLTQDLIPSFLEKLIQKMNQSPLSVQNVGLWILELLRQYIRLCTSNTAIRNDLKKLHQHALSRLRFYSHEIRLQGLLQNLYYIANRSIQENKVDADESFADLSVKPLVNYREGEESKNSSILVPDILKLKTDILSM